MIKLAELPYRVDSAALFARVQEHPWSVFLDSTHPHMPGGRHDIIAAHPFITLETVAGETRVRRPDGTSCIREDPFLVLRRTLGDIEPPRHATLPFCGGALGYFAYDLGHYAAFLPDLPQPDIAMPDLAIGIYDWAVVVDHQARQSFLVSAQRDPQTRARWQELLQCFSEAPSEAPAPPAAAPTGALRADMSQECYLDAFQRIQRYIRAGDCYQVNLAQRFQLDFAADPWSAYCGLRRRNPAPFSAFMRLPDAAVLSFSPESFLQVRGDIVTTRPIKGTRERSVFPYEDGLLARALQESEKDRAENLMIVDLLRNDISRSCIPGSVAVPQLCCLESYASVHHLVSTVTGRLQPGRHALDLLRACFPGGSITGAPKRRAMEIIRELEPCRRGVYCGTLAHIGFDGNMGSNIAIRTLVHYQGRLYCWGGGGIVSDSRALDEYQECFDKLSVIMKFFQPAATA